MSLIDFFFGKKQKAKKLLAEGKALEDREPEQAYELYSQAAELGSREAMTAIGSMYFGKSFRMVEETNLMELAAQGIPVFPWNIQRNMAPDYKTALSWFRKAADLEEPLACCMAGAMLCQGQGCSQDLEAGIRYLEIAEKAGIPEAAQLLSLYRPPEVRKYTASEYEGLLQEFTAAADAGAPEAFDLYNQLKGGSEQQLARLGYVLITARNRCDPHYAPFQYLFTPSGIPLLPACAKRGSWQTFLRLDRNAMPSDRTQIAICSDIRFHTLLHKVKPVGTVRYRSAAFGWLNEEKEAQLLEFDPQVQLDGASLDRVIRDFRLLEEEYAPENIAFLTENGEKEYSVEIAAITGQQVDILYRYTIGGSDDVTEPFQPKLLSLELT